MEGKVVGRVLEATLESARCEFDSSVSVGEVLYYMDKKTKDKILMRVDSMETTNLGGIRGWCTFMVRTDRPPAPLLPLFLAVDYEEKGILLIGHDYRGQEVRININPLFLHFLIAGMTQRGKTHLMIVLLEELAKLGIPCLVIDPQGEFVNFPSLYKNTFVVEELKIEDLVAHLQQKHIVIYNMLGLIKQFKVRRTAEILNALILEKERDYRQAENDPLLLTIPPVLIFIDETEIFAPEEKFITRNSPAESAEYVIDIAKRGSKLGLGLVLAAQRVNMLDLDVRSNCNSAAVFQTNNRSDKGAVSLMSFVTKTSLEQVKNLLVGECLIRGAIFMGSRIVQVRDIVVQRAKKVDFEDILGVKDKAVKPIFKPSIENTPEGIVDTSVGKLVKSRRDIEKEEDKAAYDASDDGVVLRDKPIDPEVEAALKKQMGQGSEGPEQEEEGEDEEGPAIKVPFKTHLSKEDREMIAALRGKKIITQ